MGANQSNLTAQSVGEDSVSAKLFSRHGFQILRVHPNSPVSEGNVQAYFDYIIAINGVEVVIIRILIIMCRLYFIVAGYSEYCQRNG